MRDEHILAAQGTFLQYLDQCRQAGDEDHTEVIILLQLFFLNIPNSISLDGGIRYRKYKDQPSRCPSSRSWF